MPGLTFSPSAVPNDFGERLAREREAARWSQARLAKRAGLRRETISRLERGSVKPVADTVFRLEQALDLTPGTPVPCWPEWAPLRSTSFGAGSRRRRRALKLSLAEVAISAGVSPATLSRFERETSASPLLVRVERTELGTEFHYLVNPKFAEALGFENTKTHERWCEHG